MKTKQAAKHTPGPWIVEKWESLNGTKFIDVLVGFETVAKCGITDDDHAEGNAHLIAAAPEILQALKIMVDAFKGKEIENHGAYMAINGICPICTGRAAIAKAEGQDN